MMLYNEHNLAVAKIASKSEIREELAGVYFTKDKTTATDSFRLLEVSTPEFDPKDYPQVEGASAMRGIQPFIVNAKMLREIKLPKKTSLPILKNVAIKHLHDNRVEFLTTNLESAEIKNVRRINATFPNYEQIFPTGEPVAEIQVNGEYLAELVAIMAKLDPTSAVNIKFYADNKPVVFEAGTAQKGRGLLMPLRK